MQTYAELKAQHENGDITDQEFFRTLIFNGIHWMNDGSLKNLGELSKETTRVVKLVSFDTDILPL